MSNFIGGATGAFFENMLRHMDAQRKAERKHEAGITLVNGLEGITRLGIPHKYEDILISDEGYFSCHQNDTMTIYTKEGKLLFECQGAEYLGYGMFLVGHKPAVTPKGKREDDFGYALYDGNKKITDYIFRTSTWNAGKFNKEGFCELQLFNSYNKVAVDKLGNILVEETRLSDPLTIKGVVCSTYKGYINLLTGEMICKKKWGSSSELSTNDTLFVEVDKNCVYQITKSTGEFIIHGEIPKQEEDILSPSTKSAPKPTPPKIKKPNRNALCHCGSGKKYKHCCLDKKVGA